MCGPYRRTDDESGLLGVDFKIESVASLSEYVRTLVLPTAAGAAAQVLLPTALDRAVAMQKNAR
jgi:hypothetical protein